MKQHPWLKTALTPFSKVYGFITGIRNRLYDQEIFSSQKASQIVISVGNLTVGGTGKTPFTEYLVALLSPVSPLAILSRGYGRKTTGFVLADENSTAETIGDEPLQFYQKFGKKVLVAVCEKRVPGAETIASIAPHRKILLLDDAFQHRAIRRDINLLLNDFNRPFYEDLPFPAGRLREDKSGAKRADAVIVTKCPDDLNEFQREEITAQVSRYTRDDTPVFFAKTAYASPVGFNGQPISLKNVKIIAGIADPGPFVAFVSQHFSVVGTSLFPDHHIYSESDVESLIKNLKNDIFALTTEKDMVKLKPTAEQAGCSERFAYIPVTVNLGADTQRFADWLGGRVHGLLTPAE